MGVTRGGDGSMRGGGAGRWVVAAREGRRRDNQPDGREARKRMAAMRGAGRWEAAA